MLDIVQVLNHTSYKLWLSILVIRAIIMKKLHSLKRAQEASLQAVKFHRTEVGSRLVPKEDKNPLFLLKVHAFPFLSGKSYCLDNHKTCGNKIYLHVSKYSSCVHGKELNSSHCLFPVCK